MTICDVYDALVSDRCYRKGLCPFAVLHGFEVGKFGKLPVEYSLLFLDFLASSLLGSAVKLKDGRKGRVIFINKHSFSRPIVQCGEEFVDLNKHKEIEFEVIR